MTERPPEPRIRIRPITPDDEPRLIDFAAKLTPDDRRMRFFASLAALSEPAAARFANPNPERECALVALGEESEDILGVARFASDDAGESAEFAVTTRSDLQGQGIGWLLMARLLEKARERRIRRLFGLVLRENHNMLHFCRDLGFTIESSDDPQIVQATLDLGP